MLDSFLKAFLEMPIALQVFLFVVCSPFVAVALLPLAVVVEFLTLVVFSILPGDND